MKAYKKLLMILILINSSYTISQNVKTIKVKEMKVSIGGVCYKDKEYLKLNLEEIDSRLELARVKGKTEESNKIIVSAWEKALQKKYGYLIHKGTIVFVLSKQGKIRFKHLNGNYIYEVDYIDDWGVMRTCYIVDY